MELSDEETDRLSHIGEHYESDENPGRRSDEAEEDNSKENDEGSEETKKRVEPDSSKKRVVRNPQPKLNADRIQGPKGVQTIEKYFQGFKFHGKGREKEDLGRVMKRLEHWAHRLFPKYRFDDFLERMEALGAKKNIQVYLKKYRLGMLSDDVVEGIVDGEVERGEELIEQAPVDDFDLLIAEQIEQQRANETSNEISSVAAEGNILGSANSQKMSELSEEVKSRIEANRKLAMERKMARAKRLEEEKKRLLEEQENNSQALDEDNIDDSQTYSHISQLSSKRHCNRLENDKNFNNPKDSSTSETIGIDITEEKSSHGPEISKTPKATENNNLESEEAMELCTPEPVAAATTANVENVPDFQNNNVEDPTENSEEMLTREELLMAIDGAIEELIAGANC